MSAQTDFIFSRILICQSVNVIQRNDQPGVGSVHSKYVQQKYNGIVEVGKERNLYTRKLHFGALSATKEVLDSYARLLQFLSHFKQ